MCCQSDVRTTICTAPSIVNRLPNYLSRSMWYSLLRCPTCNITARNCASSAYSRSNMFAVGVARLFATIRCVSENTCTESSKSVALLTVSMKCMTVLVLFGVSISRMERKSSNVVISARLVGYLENVWTAWYYLPAQ